MAADRSRHRRPVRFNRTRANPMQRLPFYRQSHARAGDYWRMPAAQGHLMGREIGRVCSLAYVQALASAFARDQYIGSAHLADIVLSAIEAHGGKLTDAEKGTVVGFFGPGSPLVALLNIGVKADRHSETYEEAQLEEALTELASLSVEQYGLLWDSPMDRLIPESQRRPELTLESPPAESGAEVRQRSARFGG